MLFAEKALVVGRLQIAFDPNFFPFIDKKSDNPRYKFLHALLGRGSDAIDTAADNADCGDAFHSFQKRRKKKFVKGKRKNEKKFQESYI